MNRIIASIFLVLFIAGCQRWKTSIVEGAKPSTVPEYSTPTPNPNK